MCWVFFNTVIVAYLYNSVIYAVVVRPRGCSFERELPVCSPWFYMPPSSSSPRSRHSTTVTGERCKDVTFSRAPHCNHPPPRVILQDFLTFTGFLCSQSCKKKPHNKSCKIKKSCKNTWTWFAGRGNCEEGFRTWYTGKLGEMGYLFISPSWGNLTSGMAESCNCPSSSPVSWSEKSNICHSNGNRFQTVAGPTEYHLLFERFTSRSTRSQAFKCSRLFHHPLIYKYIHKKHHEWTSPIGIVADYAHPIEHVVSNITPMYIGKIQRGWYQERPLDPFCFHFHAVFGKDFAH